MNLTIRPAALPDLDAIARFNLALALESENLSLDPAVAHPGAEAVLRDPSKGTYFVAELDGKITGQLLITKEWSDWRNGNFWWIQSAYVHPDFRSRGIFKAMYQHIQQTARAKKNVCGLRLYVEEHNPARKTYEKLGMKQTYYQIFEQALP